MGDLVELKIIPKESTESLVARAINMFDTFKLRVIENFIAVPQVTLTEPRKEGWQTYLSAHLAKIGYLPPEVLAAMTDKELEETTVTGQERIALLQWSFLRQHYDESMLPVTVPRIKLID